MESIQSIRDSFDAAQAIADKALALRHVAALLPRISSFYSAVGGRGAVLSELDGDMHTIASLLSKAAGWEDALDAIMLESEILLLKSQLQSDIGEWVPAAESLESAILIAQKLGDEFAHAKALRQWGLMSLMQQQPARAEELFKKSVVLFRRCARCAALQPCAVFMLLLGFDSCFSAGESKCESDTLILLAQLYEDSSEHFDRCLQYYQEALDAMSQGGDDAQPCDVASVMLRLASARLKQHLKDASDGAETEFADLEATEEELRFVIESAADLQELHLKSRAELELSTVRIPWAVLACIRCSHIRMKLRF